mgnify:CR=1 FL=1
MHAGGRERGREKEAGNKRTGKEEEGEALEPDRRVGLVHALPDARGLERRLLALLVREEVRDLEEGVEDRHRHQAHHSQHSREEQRTDPPFAAGAFHGLKLERLRIDAVLLFAHGVSAASHR